jgi:hypothetical protein
LARILAADEAVDWLAARLRQEAIRSGWSRQQRRERQYGRVGMWQGWTAPMCEVLDQER